MIKMSLIVLIGLGATLLLRRRSAATRHWILAAAIVCAAATPLLERVVPVWHLPVVGGSFLGARVAPLALFIPIHEREVSDSAGEVPQARFVPIQTASSWRSLAPVWIAGLGACLSLLVAGFARLAWLASRSQPVTGETFTATAAALSRKYGLRQPVLLLQSDHPTLLVTWGLRQPRVILPAEARGWSEERVRIVLAHELAHIRRGDWLMQMAAELLRAVYWFNPLMWIACRQLRRESEHACDDVVLGLGVEGTEYASTLLDLAQAFRQHHRTFFPAPAMARPSSLERRVTAMLNRSLNRTPLSRSACIFTVMSLLTIALPIAGLVASAQATAQFSGVLVDTVGRVLPDTPMVLSSADGAQKHRARSDQSGHFSFAGLASGDYVLEVERPGFAATQGRVTLGAGQSLMQDVALQLGTLQETITVTDGPPAVGPHRPWAAPPRPDPACTQTTVGGCIEQPAKLYDVKPRYPASLSGSGRNVLVKLEARIGVDGFVNDLRVVTPGDPDAAAAAADAVRQWGFSQTRLDGVPVEVKMNVSVMFRGQ